MQQRRTVAFLTAGALAAAALTATATLSSATPSPDKTVAAATPTLPKTGLNILLTNDDGWGALGITAVYEKLTAAGHHVIIAAPDGNQSGVSAKVSLFRQDLAVTEHSPTKFSVNDSPVTSMLYGLEEQFKKKQGKLPDLVISGTNVGENVGFDTNFSGTVGAAITAAGMYDLPTIAISTAIEQKLPLDETDGAYGKTADLLVDMIAKGIPDLDRGEVINVNYPWLNAANLPQVKGIKYTSNSPNSVLSLGFTALGQQTAGVTPFMIRPGAGPAATDSPAGSDIRALHDGYVSVSVLKADRSVPVADVPGVANLLKQLPGTDLSTVTPPVTPVTVEKIPAKVLGGTSQWLKATGANGTTVKIVWNPTAKKAKTIVRTAKISGGLVSLKAPGKAGKYKVTVSAAGKTLRTRIARVF